MKATQFFVGFGPTLWSRQKGETEYGVKAIPAGGFVKIIGMTPLEEVDAEDAPRAFINKPGWQRFIVLVAGSTMHFIIALVLLLRLAARLATGRYTAPAAVASCRRTAYVASNASACSPGAPAAPAKGKSSARRCDHRGRWTRRSRTARDRSCLADPHAAPGPVTFTVQRAGKTVDSP